MLRLGIDLLVFCEGGAEVADSSGGFERTRQRQFDPESGSAPHLRLEFYLTVVQLHKSKGVGQPDAGTARPGGEEELKDFLLVFGRDSFAGISHGNNGGLGATAQREGDAP